MLSSDFHSTENLVLILAGGYAKLVDQPPDCLHELLDQPQTVSIAGVTGSSLTSAQTVSSEKTSPVKVSIRTEVYILL